MFRLAQASFTLALCAALGACTTLFDQDAKSTGAVQIIEKKAKFIKVDLVVLLDPKNKGEHPARKGGAKAPDDDDAKYDLIENAFAGFYEMYKDNDQRVLHRNRVQSRLIAASNETCADFREKLRQLQAEPNFFLGAITTALAGAGAIVPSITAAQILSGSAGVASGIRAEFNQTYFAQLAVEVITKGIESKRKEILTEIDDRKDDKIEDYTVERAVSDALRYHGTCNLISGLEVASDRITVVDDPGLKRLKQVLGNSGATGTITLNIKPAAENKTETTAPKPNAGGQSNPLSGSEGTGTNNSPPE